MKFGEAERSHIGNVDIADSSVTALVHQLAIRIDPNTIAKRRLPAERFCHNILALAFFAYDREIDLSPGVVDKELINSAVTRYRASVQGHNYVAFGNVHARHRQW